MVALIISDVHGDYDSLYKITENEHFDKLIILGDLFSYGFNQKDLKNNKIINLLQDYSKNLILIRGNCDKYINYEALNLFAHDVITIPINNHNVTLTHGDRYSRGFLPSYHGDIFMSGHTHVPMLQKYNEIIYVNPGSIGHPRGGSGKTYAVFNNNKITIKLISGETIREMKV